MDIRKREDVISECRRAVAKGINPKAWFYGLAEALRQGRAAYTVLAGAACEQWLNGELFRFLAETLPLPDTHYPYPEAGKHDIVVFTKVDDSAAAVIEAKLVYLNYSQAKIRQYFETLGRQMRRARKKHGGSAEIIGLALGAYAYWDDQVPKRSLSEFRMVMLRQLRLAARKNGAVLAKPTVETLLKRRDDIPVGGARATVALVGQYIRLPK